MAGAGERMRGPVLQRLRVWDPLVRVLHWTLAFSVVAAFALHEWPWLARRLGSEHMLWHERLGYVALGAATLRVAWGWLGPGHARFADFVRGPRATWAYARSLLGRREARCIGHNPLGGWMVLALLANTVATAATGWLYTTDRFWGVEWLEELHGFLGELFVPLVALHLAGVAYTSWRHRENLVVAMLTGVKLENALGENGGAAREPQ